MFEHKGIKIEFDSATGKFSAEIKGVWEVGTSLAGMKKKIDKLDSFVEFSAISLGRWDATTKRVTIVGISKPRGKESWNNQKRWRDKGGSEHTNTLYKDSPENEAALQAILKLDKQHKREMEELRERHKSEQDRAWLKVEKIGAPA